MQGDLTLRYDHGKWLNLELVDDGNENAEVNSNSPLIVECLGVKNSLTNNYWSAHTYENEFRKSHKCVNTKSPQRECITGCTTDDWLEPANDWNQWNEPAYVERMNKITSSLQSYTANLIADASEMAAVDCMSIVEMRHRSKIHECLSKSDYVSKFSKKGVKCCRKKLTISDKKVRSSAIAQNTPQSNVSMDKCCTDSATCEHMEQNGKSLTSFQLIVSISFDHLKRQRKQETPNRS